MRTVLRCMFVVGGSRLPGLHHCRPADPTSKVSLREELNFPTHLEALACFVHRVGLGHDSDIHFSMFRNKHSIRSALADMVILLSTTIVLLEGGRKKAAAFIQMRQPLLFLLFLVLDLFDSGRDQFKDIVCSCGYTSWEFQPSDLA